MPKIKKKAFFYPSQPENASSASPIDQANSDINESDKRNNMLINLTEGKLDASEGFQNRKEIDEIHYHHETVSYMKYSDLETLDTPKESRTQYPFTHRLGNSSTQSRGIKKYTNDEGINTGPFNIYVQKE